MFLMNYNYDKLSPGMKQFVDIKKDYMDYILFFRMGDFYEFFMEDAITVSKELEIVLTSRSSKSEDENDRIPMCGIPFKAAESYVDALVSKGYKLAICEQIEDPKQAKGVVKRDVVQIITPGTVMNGKLLDSKSNNFICSLMDYKDSFGICYSDLSTGESTVTVVYGEFSEVLNELSSLNIKELVVSPDFNVVYSDLCRSALDCLISYESNFSVSDDFKNLFVNLGDVRLVNTCSLLFNYLILTQKRSLSHLQVVSAYESNYFMGIDMYSKRNLELFETNLNKDKKGSLLWLLDNTVTAMGGRRLKQWLERPLLNRFEIENRLNSVNSFLDNSYERELLKNLLSSVYDLERLSGRIGFGSVNGRDLIQLKKSLSNLPEIISVLSNLDNSYLNSLSLNLDLCEDLHDLLERSILDNVGLSLRDGNIIDRKSVV